MHLKFLLASTAGLALWATPALAQDAAEPAISLTSSVGVVSDYRFRGVSLSDQDFAVQGSITVNSAKGFYGSVWGSNIADYGGAKTEIDLTAGWAGSLGPVNADVNVVGYLYPGGDGVNYYEVAGSLNRDFGPLNAKLGLAYSPKQANIGDVDNTYVYGEASYAVAGTPLSLHAHAGYEDGVYTGKYDYGFGVSVDVKPFTVGVTFITVDSDPVDELGELADDTGMVSLTASF